MNGASMAWPSHLSFSRCDFLCLQRSNGDAWSLFGKFNMKHKLHLAALLCAAPLLSHAETGTLDEVIVTATRTAQSADATLASVSVITRRDIEHMQAQSLPDVLRGVPGLTLTNNGGRGKATSVFLRGANADHVLVLVDGVKIGSATLGTASFQDIPVAQIERIEIVRGPRASLYGSEAIGGVIQIFTRKSHGAPAASASFTAGSYGSYDSDAGVSGGGERGWYSARVSQQNSSGFNACRGSTTAGCYVIEPDKDGYHNTAIGLNGGYRLEGGATTGFQFLRADSNVQTDGSAYAGNQSRNRQQVLGGNLAWQPLVGWNASLRAGRANDDSDIYHNGTYISRFNTARDTVSWQNDIALDERQVGTLGFDYQNDSIDALPSVSSPANTYTRTARRNQAVYAQYQGDFGAHSLQLNARHDDNQQFGGHATGGLGYGYRLNESLRLMLNYGTAFKAPTFNQLYYPGFGSATLRPELSRSLEVGLSAQSGARRWSLNAYRTDISDLIGFDAAFNPVNINTARLTGVEAQYRVNLDLLEIGATLTWQDPRQTSGSNQGKLLNRRAQQTMRLEMARASGDYRVATSLYAEGRRYDDLANSASKRLGGYGLLDVRVEYRLAKAWQLKARVDNLLDKKYETAQYFNQPGRGLYFTLDYQQ